MLSTALDHLILGCSDLQRGIDFMERRTGVRAGLGGVHPGRGTRNALLSLAGRSYLEIMAPDPQQKDLVWFRFLPQLREPRLVGWVGAPNNMGELVWRLGDESIAFDGPTPGSRQRPDGRTLSWEILRLADDFQGSLPWFIAWSTDSPHPSTDAPAGCRLLEFAVAVPQLEAVQRMFRRCGIDVLVTTGSAKQLRAVIEGPSGKVELIS